MFNFSNEVEQMIRPLESYEYVQYNEEQGGQSEGQLAGKTNDLRIRLTDRDLITLPADSFIEVQYRVAQQNDAPYTQGNISPVNVGWSLFKRAKYLIANKDAEDIYRPQYVRLCKSLIDYSSDFEDAMGEMEFWHPTKLKKKVKGSIDELIIVDDGDVQHSIKTSGNDPHLLTITTGEINGSILSLTYRNAPVFIINKNTGLLIDDLSLVGPPGIQTIKSLGGSIIAGDVLFFYVVGYGELVFYSNGVEGIISANATPALIFNNGNALAGEKIHCEIKKSIGDFDEGFYKRQKRCLNDNTKTTNKSVSLYMPLRRLFPMLAENPIVMRGIEQEISFDLNDFSNILYRDTNVDGNADGKIILQKLSWWVPVLKPNLVIRNEFNKMLNSGVKRKLEWVATNHYYSEPRITDQSSWLIKTTEHRPVRCYIFFQKASRFSNQLQDNMVFDNFDMDTIYIRVNSERQFPNREYSLNYANEFVTDSNLLPLPKQEENYSRAYSAYLNACSAVHSDDCQPSIDYEHFKKLYAMYFFDLSAQDIGVWESTTQAHITVEYRLRSTPVENYRIHAVLDTEREIELQGINGRMKRVK